MAHRIIEPALTYEPGAYVVGDIQLVIVTRSETGAVTLTPMRQASGTSIRELIDTAYANGVAIPFPTSLLTPTSVEFRVEDTAHTDDTIPVFTPQPRTSSDDIVRCPAGCKSEVQRKNLPRHFDYTCTQVRKPGKQVEGYGKCRWCGRWRSEVQLVRHEKYQCSRRPQTPPDEPETTEVVVQQETPQEVHSDAEKPAQPIPFLPVERHRCQVSECRELFGTREGLANHVRIVHPWMHVHVIDDHATVSNGSV